MGATLANVAVDVIFDSVSVTTTYKAKLAEVGIIFGSISEAVQNHPELAKKYLGTVVPSGDNYYAALNSAVFTDGSFCYIPKGVKCPMDLSTYFRINTLTRPTPPPAPNSNWAASRRITTSRPPRQHQRQHRLPNENQKKLDSDLLFLAVAAGSAGRSGATDR